MNLRQATGTSLHLQNATGNGRILWSTFLGVMQKASSMKGNRAKTQVFAFHLNTRLANKKLNLTWERQVLERPAKTPSRKPLQGTTSLKTGREQVGCKPKSTKNNS